MGRFFVVCESVFRHAGKLFRMCVLITLKENPINAQITTYHYGTSLWTHCVGAIWFNRYEESDGVHVCEFNVRCFV